MMRKKGYTLIEILMVLALFSILFGIVFPKTNYFEKLKEKRELEDFRKDLMFARNSAILESRNYTVEFIVEKNTYYITTGKKKDTVRSKTFKDGLKFDKNNRVRSVVFNYNGTTGNSGTLYLRNNNDERYEISISPVTGRIEVKLSNFK